MFWRGLLLGAVFIYLLCAVGVFIRNIGEKNFRHFRYHYEFAAIDAVQWPKRLPQLSREALLAARDAWEAM